MGEKYPQMLMQDSDEDYAAWRDPTADDIEAHLLERPDLAHEVVERLYLRIVTPWTSNGMGWFTRERAFCEDSGIGACAEDEEGKAKVDELLKRRGFVLAEEGFPCPTADDVEE